LACAFETPRDSVSIITAASPATNRASQRGKRRGGFAQSHLREHREPLAHRGRVVVDDVVDAGSVVFER
jgi:hypothetical protein